MRQTINIINAESTHNGSPIIKQVDLSPWLNIKWAQLKVQLHSNDPNWIFDEWRIVKITVNDKVFYPSDPRNSTNKIHDNNDTDFFKGVLTTGKNRISVYWNAPLGAGVISPDSNVSAQLTIDGDPVTIVPLPEELSTINPENLQTSVDNFVKNATLPTFAILIIVAVILIFLFLALSKGATIATAIKG